MKIRSGVLLTALLLVAWLLGTGPQAWAGVTKEVTFEPGSIVSTYDGTVARGDRDVYLLKVTAGQRLSMELTSANDAAGFTVYSPSKALFSPRYQKKFNQTFPKDGTYRIEVTPAKGKAAYKLAVSVRG